MQLDVSVQKKQGDFRCDVTFQCTGDRVGLFGPSGSGKSTLAHLIAGLRRPDSGYIRLDDTTLFDSASGVNVPPEQRRVGVVFQQPHLFPHMSVLRNLLYGWRRLSPQQRSIQPESIIEVLQLGPILDRGVNRLSGGEQRRVALARTVLSCPRMILMDEPLTGLDDDLKFQIIPYLNEVFSCCAIPLLFISHSLAEMRLMTDQALVIEAGKVVVKTASEALGRDVFRQQANRQQAKQHTQP
jgi:molybdate transport system ATP-binding protein